MSIKRYAVVLGLMGWLAPMPQLSSQKAGEQKKTVSPRFRVGVNLVTVDAVVRDKKGGYPADLQAEDFEIYEDGVRQEIQDFEWIHVQSPEPAERTVPPGPPSETAQAGPQRKPAATNLFLLIIDNLNSQWANLYQVNLALEEFISKSLQRRDFAAVMTVSHTAGLLQPFTNDREALLRAARKALGLSLQGTTAASGTSRAIRDAEAASPPSPESGGMFYALPEDIELGESLREDARRLFALQNDYSARSSLQTLRSVCSLLGKIKGRKTVIFITEGFGLSTTVQAALSSAVDAANKANVSIYTINAKGLEQKDPTRPVTLAPPARSRTFASTGSAVAGNTAFDLVLLEGLANSRDECLNYLSDSTGGVVLRNSNEFGNGLETALQESHNHYQLTYVPTNQAADGKFRRIEVRLNPRLRGYSIRARGGYYGANPGDGTDVTIEDQMSRQVYDPELVSDLHTTITPYLFLSPEGENLTSLTVGIDPSEMSAVRNGAGYTADIRLLAAVFDEYGNLVRHLGQAFRFSVDQERYQEFLAGSASITVNFGLPPGRYQVKTVTRDLSSGKTGSLRRDLEIAAVSPSEPGLSSIVLSRKSFPAARRAAPQEGMEYDPFRLGETIVIPATAGRFSPEGALRVFFHAYNVSTPEDPGETAFSYQMCLYRDETLLSCSEVRRAKSEHRHAARGFLISSSLSLSPITPGNYRLEIVLIDQDGEDRASRSVPFQVQ